MNIGGVPIRTVETQEDPVSWPEPIQQPEKEAVPEPQEKPELVPA